MSFTVNEVVVSAFLARVAELGVQLKEDDLARLAAPFDLLAVETRIDERRQAIRQIHESRNKTRYLIELSEFDRRQQYHLSELTRLYATLVVDMYAKGRPMNEETAQSAKLILKRAGKNCDVFPC